ncbi:MAG TPA: NAD+ synthase [Xanthomonadaceae bacterium]|nr:NAD+ synthase [Xanthomonadaceae bacterium]
MSGRSKLRIALAQHDFPVGAVAANRERVASLIAAARDASAHLVAFPELALSGYPPEDLLYRRAFVDACREAAQDLAGAAHAIEAVVGVPLENAGALRNAALWLADGMLADCYAKQELPNHTVFDEKRYFESGAQRALVREVAGTRVAVIVCEDVWVEGPAAQAAAAGAELLLVINASPFERGKDVRRIARLGAVAQMHGLGIAYLNCVGGQDDLVFDGGSLLVDGDGRVAARAVACEEALLLADFDPATRRFRTLAWRDEHDTGEEAQVYRAAMLATADYVGKNGFPGALLGLSGGIDSALVLAIAADALGPERVTAVMLPSRYTSRLSTDLATAQAQALNVELLELPIEGPFRAFLDVLAPHFAGQPPDIAEENLQSRSRGALLMALSNRGGRLLLSTGNKSEMAVGYATLYGDMCGGFAPIKDLYKTEVYALARWRNRDGETIPQGVIERAPSAELRHHQTDQDSLPPYEVLDAILRGFIDEERSLGELLAEGVASEPEIARVVRLVLGSEFKRRQAAPGPKLGRRAFGRDRRYPITGGWKG